MLQVLLNINAESIATIKIIRREKHPQLKSSYYYSYIASYIDMDGDERAYMGLVLHNYDNGPIALVQKVTKAIVAQQKAEASE